jgi:LPXTG-site transpeptidase (sortase) family protein
VFGRRPIGVALIVSGGLLLTFAGGSYATGAMRADHARQEWNAMAARNTVAHARSVVLGFPARGRLVAGAPVVRLFIPRIGLDAIVLEGVEGRELNAGPGHVPGSALPGERGNAVISAHRDRHFNHFDLLAVGDTVVTDAGSAPTQWVITSRRVIDKDAPALFRTTDATLTLTTCWPIRYLGTAPDRLILTAKPVVGSTAHVAGTM